MFWQKADKPVDRALLDVERQLAEVRRQLRDAERPGGAPVAPRGPSSGTFVKQMLTPSRGDNKPTYHAKKADLFDVGAEPLKELEAEAIDQARPKQPELFSGAAPGGNGTRAVSLQSDPQDKLFTYLGAGSIRSFQPQRQLKSVQRRERNRFFGWLGLAVATLWLLYVMVR